MNPKTFEEIHIGSRIVTPRFSTVEITAIFRSALDASKAGYNEPTHLYDLPYKVVGKSIDLYHMTFAVYKVQ